MNIREACAAIMGERTTAAIIADQGLHWCVVAAMAAAKTSHPKQAIDAIKAWNAEQAALKVRTP